MAACDCPTTEIQNVPGASGSVGPAGPQGEQGIQGDIGPQGVQGNSGADGAPGAAGTSGVSSFTTTTSDFVQPAVGATVPLTVSNSTWITAGEPLFVTSGGSYLVTAIPDATHVTLQNLGYPGNAAPATNIPAGSLVTPSGVRGVDGSASAQFHPQPIRLWYQVAQGVAAEARIDDFWITLALNMQDDPGLALVAFGGNQFILESGIYLVSGTMYAAQCNIRTRITDVTGGGATPLLTGPQIACLNNSGSAIPISGVLSVPASRLLAWQWYSTNLGGISNLGVAMNIAGESEIYRSLTLLRVNDYPWP